MTASEYRSLVPTANTSPLETPHTPERMSVPVGITVHVLPLKCRMPPGSPATKTSLPAVPQTPLSVPCTPLGIGLQAPPSKWRIVPEAPTANTSFGPLPHTERRPALVPLGIWLHCAPS